VTAPTLVTTAPPPSLHQDRDFRRLWSARAVSDLGSAVTMVTLPLVAVIVLNASAFEVTLVSVFATLAGALFALPLGSVVEYRRKRPTMVFADLVRALSLISVPAAAAFGVLTVAQLCAVAMLNGVLMIAFNSAGQAHLKNLVGRDRLGEANGRFESTLWIGYLIGPPLGGAIAGAFGAAVALLIDAMSYVVSAVCVRSIRRPEPAPPRRDTASRAELSAGLRFLFGHPGMRGCLLSYVLFSGTVYLMSPLETLFLVRDLGAAPWAYGLVMGVPCAAGVLGARIAPKVLRRWGPLRALRWAAWARSPWMLVFPLAWAAPLGLALAGLMLSGTIVFAAVFSPALATYRQLETPDELMSRAVTAWSVVIRVLQPVFILIGGVLAATVGVRPALWIGAVGLAASALLLPNPDVPQSGVTSDGGRGGR
jgi:predicted MFS family arabinose efflux permease